MRTQKWNVFDRLAGRMNEICGIHLFHVGRYEESHNLEEPIHEETVVVKQSAVRVTMKQMKFNASLCLAKILTIEHHTK